MAALPAAISASTSCPACGEPRFRRSQAGETELFICPAGCVGRRIAAKMGVPLPVPAVSGPDTALAAPEAGR